MNSIASIALSGLQAASQRLEVASNNIANAASTSALPESGSNGASTYAAQQVNQQTQAGGGVGTSVSLVDPAILTAAQSGPSSASQNGLETGSDVDLTGQVIEQKAALQAYQASAQLVNVANQLDTTLLHSTDTTIPHHHAVHA
jgi:flagellar basal-body rod protein FlgC